MRVIIILGLFCILLILMKSKSYSVRAVGAAVIMGGVIFIYETSQLVTDSYGRSYSHSAIVGIKDLIETNRATEAVDPIVEYEAGGGNSFTHLAHLASKVSKLRNSEPVGMRRRSE